MSPFLGKGFRDDLKRKPRPVSCPESPRNLLKLPKITAHDDNFLHKPTVHFNVEPFIRKTVARKKRPSASATHKDQHTHQQRRDSVHYDTPDVSYQDREIETYEIDSRSRSNSSSRRGSMRVRRFPELPTVSQQQRPSPAPRRQMNQSTGDLSNEPQYAPQPKPIINPRSYQKGLIRIVSSSAESSPSKIPRRTSVSKSMERIPSLQRRKSISRPSNRRNRSESPERQRSVDSSTMIDLGVTASSMVRAANRISRPSALSPIVGTPNKDQGDNQLGTRIPVRRNSSINLNVKSSSRGNSRIGSRETSPAKPGTSKSPTKIPKKIGQTGFRKVSSLLKATSKKGASSGSTSSASDGAKAAQQQSATHAAKKESASARKEPSTMSREKSSVKKAPSAAVKREPATLKRQTSNLKRETSNLKPSTLKRENSTLKRQASTVGKKEPTTLHKNQSDSSLAKRLDKKSSFKNNRRTSSESDGLNERVKGAASDILIALNTVSAALPATAAIAAQPVQITAAVTNQLNKSNSSNQIPLNGSSGADVDAGKVSTPAATAMAAAAATAAAAAIDESRRELTTPAEIIENATKTLETIQKTVTDATDEIHKTIEENLTDLKSLEKDMQMSGAAAAGESDHATAAPLQKKASTRTLGGKSDIVKSDVSGSDKVATDVGDAEHSAPIETTVNVIDGKGGDVTALQTQDSDERMSERAISMEPDVELDGPNVQKMEESMQQQQQQQQNTNGGPTHMESGAGDTDNR